MKTNSDINWTVQKPEAGMPLQEFLALKMGVSKRVAKHQLDAKAVRVNGRAVWIARHALRADDKVSLVARVKSPTALSERVKKITILFEDENYIIADKPLGLVVNAADYSVENILRAQTGNPALKASHRLDRDTTGCILLSKSEAAHAAAVDVFKRHNVSKTYRTVVDGRWDAAATTIEIELDSARASTGIHCLRATDSASYIVARIETGRTHQIRRHLAMARHPVIGDTEYGRKDLVDPRLERLTHPLLHAVELALEHPLEPGKTLKAFSPVPQDFHRWLKALRLE